MMTMFQDQASGEHSQDQWSSGFYLCKFFFLHRGDRNTITMADRENPLEIPLEIP